MSNEQTMKDVYAAFQAGDVSAIVARVTDDVDWRNDRVESRECPWNDSVHFWTFNDRGQIARYRHFNHTAAELAAWRG